MDKHKDFIQSPIIRLLEDVVAANVGIGDGMETYPLSEYILQSVFLKMTGFQEQKMKCIVWELATDDYEYRYKRYTLTPYGECSSYKEKKDIYGDLTTLIKKYEPAFDVTTAFDKAALQAGTLAAVRGLFAGTNISTWAQSSYFYFVKDNMVIPTTQFLTENNLFETALQGKHDMMVYHRNRCAHNTFSYQENLPTLNTLLRFNPKDDNYFVRFTLLVLLDSIFMELYTKYKNLFDTH